MIGGYRKNEDNEKEVTRLIKKELALNNFSTEDYSFEPVLEKEEIFKISLRNGIYQKYKADLFQIKLKGDIKVDKNDRWITFKEIANGVTEDGVSIASLFSETNSEQVKRISEKLQKLELSLETKQENKNKVIGVTNDDVNDIKQLVNSEESLTLEFKSSVRWDYHNNKLNRELEKVIMKTLNAFLNSDGGTLVIGVSDEKEILGLEPDFKNLRRKDPDGFQQLVSSLIHSYLGVDITSLINIEMVSYQDKFLSIIKVKKSPKPVFMKEGEKREFYIRAGNTSKLLNPEEIYNYIQLNW